ncbi:hypothetical protein SO694_00036048 [Aureococcus anophagefferens]|uniref:Ubiquitin-like domain-containing protein n=1 Tax=Aureococcus anophagefferens TaxID=44056 RepID=A0ABR1FL70_AURAN
MHENTPFIKSPAPVCVTMGGAASMGGGSLGELRLAVAQLDDVSKPPARRRAALDEAVALLRRRPEPTAEVRRLALRCAEAARRWSDDAGAAGCEAWRRWYAFAAAEIYCGLGEAEGSTASDRAARLGRVLRAPRAAAAAGDACACCPAAPAARRRGGGPGGSVAAPASRDAAGAGLTLFVSMPDGRTTTLRDVAPDCQVDELKACLATIADRAGGYDSTKPCADVELVYGSRHLASGASVAQYRLPQNATLYGLVGLLGGKRARKKKSKTKDPVRCTLRQWVDTGYLDGRAYVCSWRHAEGCKVCQDRPFAPANRPADERKAGWQGPGFFTKRYREHSYVVAPGLPPPRPDEPGVHPALAAIKKTECDAGYQWLLESDVGHFRCAGGSHTATADEFQKLVDDFGFPDLAHFVTSKKKLWLKWHGKTVDDYLRAAYFTRERRDRAAELSPASANWELAKRTFKQRYALWKRKSENYAVDAKVCAAHDFPLN